MFWTHDLDLLNRILLVDISGRFGPAEISSHETIQLGDELHRIKIFNYPKIEYETNSFQGLKALEFVEIDEGIFHEAPLINESCSTLITLSYEHVGLQSLPEGYFDGCDKLSTLRLNGNKLEVVPDVRQLKKLTTLELNNNRIKEVGQDFYLTHLPELRRLHLRQNRLTSVDKILANIMDVFPRITFLSLSDNPVPIIKDPSHYYPNETKRKISLYLTGDQYTCNESMLWLSGYGKDYGVYEVEGYTYDHMICASPYYFRGEPLNVLQNGVWTNIKSGIFSPTYIAVITIALLCLVIIIAGLVFRHIRNKRTQNEQADSV